MFSIFGRGALFAFTGILASTAAPAAMARALSLDAIVAKAARDDGAIGASVLVARHGRIVYQGAYGLADRELQVPAKASSVYHIIGPGVALTAVATMQLVERGELGLDDRLSKFLPEFPRSAEISIRQLLNSSSGIADYHYLGDPLEATYRTPKALDEMIALFSAQPAVHPPGQAWDWSVSNYDLLSLVIEKVSGESYRSYVQERLFAPAGVKHAMFCDDLVLTPGLGRGYRFQGGAYRPAPEAGEAVGDAFRYCGTVEELFKVWAALRAGLLLKPETFAAMAVPGLVGAHEFRDPEEHFGYGLILDHEGRRRDINMHGGLLGYSGALYEFPGDDLVVIALSNTEGQSANSIAKAVARKILALPDAPGAADQSFGGTRRILADLPVSAQERVGLMGTFRLKVDGGGYHDTFTQYRRTYRVFEEAGLLMIQALGDAPERLLKQADGSFAIASDPDEPIVFGNNSKIPTLSLHRYPGLELVGPRIGPGDARAFHGAADAEHGP